MDEKSTLERLTQQWRLAEPRLVATTATSSVYRARREGGDAALKILNELGRRVEADAPAYLRWADGCGAVRLLDSEPEAHLLEWLDGRSLVAVVENGGDDRATDVVAEVASRLHQNPRPLPGSGPEMSETFAALFRHAETDPTDSRIASAAAIASRLIATTREVALLHGDLHHGNIMESPRRGWVAIDPQPLIGDPAFDLTAVFYNPSELPRIVQSRARIERLGMRLSAILGLNSTRLLEFAFAVGMLRGCWQLDDGQDPAGTFAVAELVHDLLR